jgi:hypothetical protein
VRHAGLTKPQCGGTSPRERPQTIVRAKLEYG